MRPSRAVAARPEPESRAPMPIRFRILALITIGTMINYVDRINIAVAAPNMMADMGVDEARFGWAFSIFLLGYALFQYPGGALSDRWSARKVIALSCVGFSGFTALTPLGEAALPLLFALRFLVGACESMSFPSFASMNSRWIPRSEFARAQSWLLAGVYLGQIVAYPTTSWIIKTFSWQMVFYVNAAIGMVWVAGWYAFVRDTPREHPSITQVEVERIESDIAPKSEVRASLVAIVTCRPILITMLSYMLYGFIAWLYIFWFPTYLAQERGLSEMTLGWTGMLPIAAGFLGVMAGGWLWDVLLKRGVHPRTARVRLPGLCIIASAPFLVAAVVVESTVLCIAGFGVFYFLFSSSLPGFWSLPLELNPKFVGSIIGVWNTMANFVGIFGPLSAGYLVSGEGGDWETPFFLAAALAVVCGAIYTFFVRTDPIDIEAKPAQAIA